MSISCIAIDDDLSSLQNLVEYIKKSSNLELIQTFTEPLKALAEISVANPVDIIFMDIEMPTLSGIELATLLRQKTKYLVFTTAHSKYAIDAFKVEADAYLLKPFSILHFEKMINTLYPITIKKENVHHLEEQSFSILTTKDDKETVKVELLNLIAIEDFGNEFYLITTNGSYTVLKETIAKLLVIIAEHPGFIEIAKNVIISKHHIKSVIGNQILLSEKKSYPLADSHKEYFDKFVSNNHHADKNKSI